MTAPNPTHAAEALLPQMVQQADSPTPQAEVRAGDKAPVAGREDVGALMSPTRHRTRSALSVTAVGALIAGLFVFATNTLNRNFDSLEASINLTNARIDDTNARIGRIEDRIDRIEVKIDALDDRMDSLDDRIDAMGADISAVLAILIERRGAGAVPEAGASGT